MDVHASLRSLRMSPRKVRLVIDVIRGQNVPAAETRLAFMKQLAARPVLKLLRSAVANADHNFHLEKDTLYVKTVTADGGPNLKRSMPRAFGRANPIRERTTHIMLVLAPRAPADSAKAEGKTKKRPRRLNKKRPAEKMAKRQETMSKI